MVIESLFDWMRCSAEFRSLGGMSTHLVHMRKGPSTLSPHRRELRVLVLHQRISWEPLTTHVC